MRHILRYSFVLAFAVWLAASSAAQTVNCQYSFVNFTAQPQNVRRLSLVPILPPAGTSWGTNQVLPTPKYYSAISSPVMTNGYLTVSNIIPGIAYHLQLADFYTQYDYTNYFYQSDAGTTVNGAQRLAFIAGPYVVMLGVTNLTIATNYVYYNFLTNYTYSTNITTFNSTNYYGQSNGLAPADNTIIVYTNANGWTIKVNTNALPAGSGGMAYAYANTNLSAGVVVVAGNTNVFIGTNLPAGSGGGTYDYNALSNRPTGIVTNLSSPVLSSIVLTNPANPSYWFSVTVDSNDTINIKDVNGDGFSMVGGAVTAGQFTAAPNSTHPVSGYLGNGYGLTNISATNLNGIIPLANLPASVTNPAPAFGAGFGIKTNGNLIAVSSAVATNPTVAIASGNLVTANGAGGLVDSGVSGGNLVTNGYCTLIHSGNRSTFSTLETANSASHPGDTIICYGTLNVSNTVVATNLTLIGYGCTLQWWKTNAQIYSANNISVCIDPLNSSVYGFTITNMMTGYFQACLGCITNNNDPVCTNFWIQDVNCYGDSDCIYITGAYANGTVINSRFQSLWDVNWDSAPNSAVQYINDQFITTNLTSLSGKLDRCFVSSGTGQTMTFWNCLFQSGNITNTGSTDYCLFDTGTTGSSKYLHNCKFYYYSTNGYICNLAQNNQVIFDDCLFDYGITGASVTAAVKVGNQTQNVLFNNCIIFPTNTTTQQINIGTAPAQIIGGNITASRVSNPAKLQWVGDVGYTGGAVPNGYFTNLTVGSATPIQMSDGLLAMTNGTVVASNLVMNAATNIVGTTAKGQLKITVSGNTYYIDLKQ